MTTLVTGSTGLVGYNIVQTLLARGRKVRVLVRSLEKAKRLLPSDCEIVQGDITDKHSLVGALEGCDVVYHAAGFPEQWMPNPAIFHAVNVEGTENIIEAALMAKVRRFIFTSTIDVFAADVGVEYDERLLDPKPKGTYYERSKQEADKRVVAALERGLPAVFLHPSGVYGIGPSDSPGMNGLLKRLAAKDVPALLPGGMPIVFAADVGEGHVLAEEKANIGERFILSESYHSMRDLASLMLEELQMNPVPTRVMPLVMAQCVSFLTEVAANLFGTPPLIPKGQLHFLQWQARPQSQKAQSVLGWKPINAREGIRATIQFMNLLT